MDLIIGTYAPPLGPPDPNYREEVSLYTALPSTALLYGRALLDTLHQRVGDEFQQCGCTCCERSFFKNFWTRVIMENGKQDGGNIFHHGPDFRYNLLAFQSGIDVYRRANLNGRDHLGILGAVGRGRSTAKHFDNTNAGTNKFNAYTAGFYWTHFGSRGWYLDNVFQKTWYQNMKADSYRIQALKTHGGEYAASIEAGYPWKCKYFTLEPQAQLVYETLSLHDSEDIAAEVDFHRTNSVLGRLGVRLANTWFMRCLPSSQPRQITGWVRTDIWRDFNGNSKTYFSSEEGLVGFASDLQGNWFEGTVGLTAQITDVLSFYGSFTGNVYLNGRGYSYNGTAGFRADF